MDLTLEYFLAIFEHDYRRALDVTDAMSDDDWAEMAERRHFYQQVDRQLWRRACPDSSFSTDSSTPKT